MKPREATRHVSQSFAPMEEPGAFLLYLRPRSSSHALFDSGVDKDIYVSSGTNLRVSSGTVVRQAAGLAAVAALPLLESV